MVKLTDRPSPNQVFYLLIGVVIISLLIVASIAGKQNEYYLDQHQQYLKGASLVKEGKYKEALTVFGGLNRGFADSYQVLYLKGASHLQNRQFSEAAKSLEQALKQKPALLQDHNFLYLCGEVYYQQQDYGKARLYWEQSLKFAPDREFKDKINQLLNTLRNQGGA